MEWILMAVAGFSVWAALSALSYLSDIAKELRVIRLMLQTSSDYSSMSALNSIGGHLELIGERLRSEGVVVIEKRRPVA